MSIFSSGVRLKFSIWVAVFLVTNHANAILPLPYPLEPISPESISDDAHATDTSTVFQGYQELFAKGQMREMELPTFESQKEAIGYEPGATFVVTAELRPRVDFWKRIYADYTTLQAVLHDSEDLSVTYNVVDISHVQSDASLTPKEKRRRLAKFLKAEKEKVSDQLKLIHAAGGDPLKIAPELFPLFRKFPNTNDRERFLNASKRVRAQVGQRDRIVRGFLHGGRYFAQMMEIFESKRIPKELTRLPLVESGFDLAARSKVGASGVWQFMRATGKMYLKIDKSVDERNDPISATWAAAELLGGNYQKLTAWPLAITAYNHGADGMARAMKELSTRDLATIIRGYKSKSFGFASSNFYSEFLAILEVEKDYRKYFGKLMVDKPLESEVVRVTESFSLDDYAKLCDSMVEELAILNPALTDAVLSGTLPVPGGFSMKVPKGHSVKCVEKAKKEGKV